MATPSNASAAARATAPPDHYSYVRDCLATAVMGQKVDLEVGFKAGQHILPIPGIAADNKLLVASAAGVEHHSSYWKGATGGGTPVAQPFDLFCRAMTVQTTQAQRYSFYQRATQKWLQQTHQTYVQAPVAQLRASAAALQQAVQQAPLAAMQRLTYALPLLASAWLLWRGSWACVGGLLGGAALLPYTQAYVAMRLAVWRQQPRNFGQVCLPSVLQSAYTPVGQLPQALLEVLAYLCATPPGWVAVGARVGSAAWTVGRYTWAVAVAWHYGCRVPAALSAGLATTLGGFSLPALSRYATRRLEAAVAPQLLTDFQVQITPALAVAVQGAILHYPLQLHTETTLLPRLVHEFSAGVTQFVHALFDINFLSLGRLFDLPRTHLSLACQMGGAASRVYTYNRAPSQLLQAPPGRLSFTLQPVDVKLVLGNTGRNGIYNVTVLHRVDLLQQAQTHPLTFKAMLEMQASDLRLKPADRRRTAASLQQVPNTTPERPARAGYMARLLDYFLGHCDASGALAMSHAGWCDVQTLLPGVALPAQLQALQINQAGQVWTAGHHHAPALVDEDVAMLLRWGHQAFRGLRRALIWLFDLPALAAGPPGVSFKPDRPLQVRVSPQGVAWLQSSAWGRRLNTWGARLLGDGRIYRISLLRQGEAVVAVVYLRWYVLGLLPLPGLRTRRCVLPSCANIAEVAALEQSMGTLLQNYFGHWVSDVVDLVDFQKTNVNIGLHHAPQKIPINDTQQVYGTETTLRLTSNLKHELNFSHAGFVEEQNTTPVRRMPVSLTASVTVGHTPPAGAG